YFTAAGRIDFRDLVRDLASIFHLRIELRQIGIRDETKMLGGIAPCGRPCCCASCMPDFRKVSIKMAKVQGLSLNPGKISGLCGRLMCCLEYENEYYSKVYKEMPRIGSVAKGPDGEGVVIGNNMLKFLVKLRIENSDGSLMYKEYPLDKVTFNKGSMSDDVSLTKEEEAELKNLEE
ncbi:MAG: stage 0 sporulation protein, partial [Clostridia bacterium]|nr:stage 0 sporulation protein [Clostridia bacterium]